MADASATQSVRCPTCGATLTVHMDRWHADVQSRQTYTCPACAKRHEGTFGGRVIQVVRDLPRA
jgi:hypothetical protein